MSVKLPALKKSRSSCAHRWHRAQRARTHRRPQLGRAGVLCTLAPGSSQKKPRIQHCFQGFRKGTLSPKRPAELIQHCAPHGAAERAVAGAAEMCCTRCGASQRSACWDTACVQSGTRCAADQASGLRAAEACTCRSTAEHSRAQHSAACTQHARGGAHTCVKVRNSETKASLKPPPETRASISSVATKSSGPAFLCSLFCRHRCSSSAGAASDERTA